MKFKSTMRNIYKSVGVFAAICVLAGLFFSVNPSANLPDNSQNYSLPLTKPESIGEVQPKPTGQDPFQKFIEEKTSSLNSAAVSENQVVTPPPTSKDPFKEFLEKQNQASRDQVVSPFGKN
jgi:hypothetical protein